MKATKPEVFTISHRLAEKAAETWVSLQASVPRQTVRWRKKNSERTWTKRDWQTVRRGFDAGARWMLRPFQQVCGLDRGPTGKQFTQAWKETRARIAQSDPQLRESLVFAWHSGRVFLELWIQNERFPSVGSTTE